jgi:hypothetical protein
MSSHHQVKIASDNLLLPSENINNYRSGVSFLLRKKMNKKAAVTAGDLLFDLTFILYTA